MTPPADLALRARRWLVAILHRATAGEKARALAEVDELIGLLPSGPLRAEAIGLRVAIDFGSGDRYLEQALAETDDDELAAGSDPRAVRLGGGHLPWRAAAGIGAR